VVATALLMLGLRGTPASSASLLLNLEGVFTATLAWFVFRENFDRRIFAGMAAILARGALLSWSGRPSGGIPWASLGIAGACLYWALDNNLTRKISAAGAVNVGIAPRGRGRAWAAELRREPRLLRPGAATVRRGADQRVFLHGSRPRCRTFAGHRAGTADARILDRRRT
jgi:hypothetical protein